MKPLLLVDVDGVLNCFGSLWTAEHEERAFEVIDRAPYGFRVRIPKGTRERMAQLVERFEPVWATAWGDDAHGYFAERLALGPAWPVVSFSQAVVARDRSWKWRSVEHFMNEQDRPAAWVDDDLSPLDFAWARDRCALGLPTLLVRTEAHVGLTDAHVSELLAWAGAATTTEVPS